MYSLLCYLRRRLCMLKYFILLIISSLFSLTTVTLYYDNSVEKMALYSNMETADSSVMTIHIYFPKLHA